MPRYVKKARGRDKGYDVVDTTKQGPLSFVLVKVSAGAASAEAARLNKAARKVAS